MYSKYVFKFSYCGEDLAAAAIHDYSRNTILLFVLRNYSRTIHCVANAIARIIRNIRLVCGDVEDSL